MLTEKKFRSRIFIANFKHFATSFSGDLLGLMICYCTYRVVGKYIFKARNKKVDQQRQIENSVKHQRQRFLPKYAKNSILDV